MSLDNLFRMHSLAFPTGTAITQFTDLSLSTGLAELVVAPSGDTTPGFTGINEGRPEASFSTQQIWAVIAQMATGALMQQVASDLSGGNVVAIYRRGANLGTLEAEGDSAHLQALFEENCLFCWSTIRASQGGLADISCRLVPTYDGTNSPMQIASGQAITPAAVVNELYTLGPIKLNGSFVPGVQDMTIESGVSVRVVADSGSPWPTLVMVESLAPRLSFTTFEADLLASMGVLGTPLTGLLAYLQKKAAGGAVANVAPGTAEHIKVTCASGAGMAVVRGPAGADGLTTVDIPLKRPSANTAVWTISQAAIT